ncbi:33464_t:CDS:2 [Gigaspora margarita]|uniref:33464_t:CDS:1 n=1 Tax=Gigaspora margarita TaxID=4874 RepID=A0ABN7W364_GIGMA|nr:33464_t:CDS:2 [Gigaspora margarita]
MNPVITEINWINKLNKYRNVFALSTEKFKKFVIIQNEKKEVIKRVLIEQECGYQDYGIQELTNKLPNLESEEQSSSNRLEIKAKKMTEYKCMLASYNKNLNPTTTDICTVGYNNTKAMKTTTQNTDRLRDFFKLTKTELEIQYKKAVYIFII